MKEKVRKIKKRMKAMVRRRKYLCQKKRQQKKDENFISQLLVDSAEILDYDFRKLGWQETRVRTYSDEDYLRIERLLDEINRRAKLYYDPIEIIVDNIEATGKNQVFCRYIYGRKN
jgi:PP-loop superfamily ATP-utilizing enzyme